MQPGAPPRPGLTAGERALFAALAALSLAVLWAFRHFPSQDGPIHLEIAGILRHLWAGDSPSFARFFEINRVPEPNWFVYLPLAGLFSLVPPLAAEKLLLSGYAVLLPLALLYALRGVRPAAAWLALLSFPMIASFLLHMGFYNYCYGTALMLVALGFWLRRRRSLGWAGCAGLAVCFLAVGLAHPVALLVACLAIGCVVVWEALAAPAGARARTLLRLALPPFAAALPALVPLALFVGQEGSRDYQRMSGWVLVRHLATLWSLVSYSRAEMVVSLGLAALLSALARTALRGGAGPALARGLGGAVLLLTLTYLLAPVGLAGGGYLNQRLQLPLLLLVVLWLGSLPGADRLRVHGRAAAALLALAGFTLQAAAYRRLDPPLAELRSIGAQLAPGSTVLVLSFSHHGRGPDGKPLSLRIRPFQHLAGYLSAERGVIDLTNYQADRGYFPVLYRRPCDPYGPLGTIDEIESEPPRVHLRRYRQALARGGCGDVDYVLLWQLDPASHADPAVAALLEELVAGYQPVDVSRPHGLGRLYRRIAQFPLQRGAALF